MRKPALLVASIAALALAVTAGASADSVGPITFEPPAYSVGSINGQNGWTKTGGYDVAVAPISSFPAAAGIGFGTQALRLSNAVTSGAFGDQTFAPPLASPAGESTGQNHFEASFSIGTALATQQPGLALSVSPDDGSGGRMSYLRFEDQADGVHVFFDDVTDAGPVGTKAAFNEHDIAVLGRGSAHTIRFSIDFVPGPGNDVVRIYVDGALKATGTTWEDYYRYDPEQAGGGNTVPVTRTLIFREAGTAASTTNGNGFVLDDVAYASSNLSAPTGKGACTHGGWRTFAPPFRNQGQCIKALKHNGHGHGHGLEAHGKGAKSGGIEKHHGPK
jgi:hypothetical protein